MGLVFCESVRFCVTLCLLLDDNLCLLFDNNICLLLDNTLYGHILLNIGVLGSSTSNFNIVNRILII
jgi:hypothetical protein